MSVKIRLKRVGAKKAPYYRLVVTDARNPRDGRFIEEIGYYDAKTDPGTVSVSEERALKWLLDGAQPSQTVRKLFSRLGIMTKLDEIRRSRT